MLMLSSKQPRRGAFLMTIPIAETRNQQAKAEPQLIDLFSFVVGQRHFAVFAEDVEGTAESKRPAPLPQAPPAILGIVCVRGRMLTTLDAIALSAGARHLWPEELACVIALRGDEQLALAADSLGETITLAATDIEPAGDGAEDQASQVVSGIVRHAGQEIAILNTGILFAAALRRKERRRRRF
jgi:purine-binding chemotaxis protein CheW